MCSLFYIDETILEKLKAFATEMDSEAKNVCLGRDIRPTERALILKWNGKGICLSGVKWGYPGIQKSGVLINARAESVLEKKIFADGIRYHRAVIPASHFYEWNQRKEKNTFKSKDGEILYLAGFFDIMENEERFVILTTEANASMKPVHDRMPLILRQDQIEDWLRDEKATEAMLCQTPEELKLDKEQKTALLNAYETDVLNVSADTFIDSEPMGELEITFPNPVLKEHGTLTDDGMISYITSGSAYYGDGNSIVPQLYLYPEYKNTLSLLEEYDYTLRTEIDPESVSSVTVYPDADTIENNRCDDLIYRLSDTAVINYEGSGSEMSIIATARDDIALILSYMEHYAGGILDTGNGYPDSMEVQYKNGSICSYSLKL